MKLLFCTHDIDSGGSARSLSILLERLSARHEITLVSTILPDKNKGYISRYIDLGIKTAYFPWGWLPVDLVGCDVDAKASRKLCAQLRPLIPDLRKIAQNADAICFNGYPSFSLAPALPPDIPKYLIAREVLREDSPGYAQCARLLRKHIKRALAIGPVEAAQLDRMGIPNEIVFNTPASPPRFAPLPPAPPLHLGVFSQFVPCKGLDVLIRAAQAAAPAMRKHSAMIHMFGGSVNGAATPLENQLRNLVCGDSLEDIIVFEGWVEDVEAKMKAMHCLVRPDTTGSPWGRDVIEAMSIGRPVLATGFSEIFVKSGQTGLLVEPNNAEELAAALIVLAKSSRLLTHMAKNAFGFAARNFDPRINSEKIEKIICGAKDLA